MHHRDKTAPKREEGMKNAGKVFSRAREKKRMLG